MQPICIVCWQELPAERVKECAEQFMSPCCKGHEEEASQKQNEQVLNGLADITRKWQPGARARKGETMTNQQVATKWVVEAESSESDINEVISLSWGIATPNEPAELNTTYRFFESEQEAARYFLKEVQAYPAARASVEDIELANKAVNQ